MAAPQRGGDLVLDVHHGRRQPVAKERFSDRKAEPLAAVHALWHVDENPVGRSALLPQRRSRRLDRSPMEARRGGSPADRDHLIAELDDRRFAAAWWWAITVERGIATTSGTTEVAASRMRATHRCGHHAGCTTVNGSQSFRCWTR